MKIKLTLKERLTGEVYVPDYQLIYKKKLALLVDYQECQLEFLKAYHEGRSEDARYFLSLSCDILSEEI